MKKILVPALLLVLYSCNTDGASGSSYNDDQQEYANYLAEKENELFERERRLEEQNKPEALKENLGDLEKRNPKAHLSLDFKISYKFLADDDVVKGRIYNSAAVTEFKDVQIEVKCYSKTGTVIDTEYYTIYEFVSPQNSIPYEIRFKSPRGTKTIGAEIVGAAF